MFSVPGSHERWSGAVTIRWRELLRLSGEVAARNLSVKARQRPVSWLQGEVETPPSLHHLPRGCTTQGCHSNKSRRLISSARLTPFHPAPKMPDILFTHAACDWQTSVPEECDALQILSLCRHNLFLFYLSAQ